ncbi:MAG TPA: SusC/RagA family TonB-linked outer membrane protein [Gemmatimonadales bacterium]|nr:SusC/RagA family TonB-linked outer membrane protein [Gemmatimonadales bacterium]
MRRLFTRAAALLLLGGLSMLSPAPADAQVALASRSPRFLLAMRPGDKSPVEVNPSRVASLRHKVSLDLHDVRLGAALDAIARQTGIKFVYVHGMLPVDSVVQFRAEGLSVAAALTELLLGTPVDVVVDGTNQVVLTRAADRVAPGSVSGRVTEAKTGQPIAQAEVLLPQARRQTTTGDDGRYRFGDVPPGTYTVAVRRIGYAAATRSVTVGDGEEVVVDLALTPVATRLEEVVTTATGDQRRVELGNVIGEVAMDSLVGAAPVRSLADAIGARVPGVQLSQNTGYSGESPRIRIRGISSATLSRDPLVIVDGVRVEASAGAAYPAFDKNYSISRFGELPGRMGDLNPEEIESVEIVKGPSAATLYGTDAANGVIVVKTKRGQPGRARWTLYGEGSMSKPAVDLPENYFSWGRNTSTNAVGRCQLLQSAAGTCTIDSLTHFSPLSDPATTMIGTGHRWQAGAQVSGGADRLRYFLSAEYETERGYLRMPEGEVARVLAERGETTLPDAQRTPNWLRRVSLRSNLSTALGSRGDITLSTGLTRSNVRIPRGSEWVGAYWGSGVRDATNGYWAGYAPGEIFAHEPLEDASRYLTSLNANYRPFDWLATRGTVGLDFTAGTFEGLVRRGQGTASVRRGQRFTMQDNTTLFTADLGASALTHLTSSVSSRTTVGVQYNRRRQYLTMATGTGLPPGSVTLAGAETLTNDERTVETVVAGAYVEQGFGFNERLFVTGALRADGASSFGDNFSTALYPKGSVSWHLSDEPFFPRIPGLGSLRLRAAYGASGVQPGPADALATLDRLTTVVDGVPTSGAVLTAIGNPNLKPERTREIEAGVDMEWFDGRIRLEATYYDKLSTDALIDRPMPSSVGIAVRRENLGSVRNRGWEGLLTLIPVRSDAVTWDLTLNGSINRNKLERIDADVTFLTNPTAGIVEGYPLFSRWDRPILGYSDANGNGILEASEVQVGDTSVFIGEAHPPKQLTVATGVSLFRNRVRISSQFDYRGGHVGMNFTDMNRCSLGSCRAVNDPAAPLAEQARWIGYNDYATWAGYMESTEFLRWRELALTVDMPRSFAAALGGRSMSVTLSGRNLKLWTDYTGPDPELNSSPGLLYVEGPSDNPSAPQSRYWMLRVNFGF